MKKWINKTSYLVALLTLIAGIILIIIAVINPDLNTQLAGYITIATASALFIVSFGWDFKQTMVINETAGDKYTLMTKAALLKEIKKRDIKCDEKTTTREYYLVLLRDYDQKKLEDRDKDEE